MKEQWSISKDKLVALEDGTSCKEEQECAKSAGRSNACTQAIQTVKFILYLELLVIVAWACYSIWKPYHVQSMEVKVTDILREPESPNVILLEEQPTQETSTIAARPVYGSEDSLKRQDAVDDLPKFVPDDLKEIFNSENTESSLGWPVSFDYSNFGDAMNFRFVAPSLSSMEVDEREKELGSSESAQRLIDNKSEQSQQSKEYEKSLLGNYMLLSLLVQNAARISEAMKDSKEIVDPKFEFKLENSGPLELEDSSRLELDNSGPLPWFSSVRLESEKEIDSDLEDSEGGSSSTQIYDNYESGTLNILNNTHETVPEDGTEPEQQETSIKSNEQMPQSMDSGEKEGKHEEEQSSLEKSAMRNAEASEDSNEEVDQNSNSGLLETQDSGPSEFEYWGSIEWDRLNRYRSRVSPLLDWEYSDPLEQQKEFGSDLEDSQDKPSSTQTDDNYESTTLNILNNTHETVPEDSTEPEQEETSIKSNEQMPQSMDSGWTPDWVYQSASEERKHEEEQATETTASDETEAETEDDEIPLFSFDFSDSVENTHSLLHSDAGESEESESHSFVWGTFYKIAKQAQTACSEIIYPGVVIHHEDANYSYERDAQARCDKHKKTFCEYLNRTLKLTDCSNFSILRSKVVP